MRGGAAHERAIMSFANLTRYAALDVPYLAPDGREVVITVVKATYSFGRGGLELAARQNPVRLVDEWHDPDAPSSSVRLPGDLVTEKRGADVIVVGSARSVTPTPAVDVVVGVGDRRVQLRVHGERRYYRGAGGRVVIGKAAPFVEIPVVYERAWGGSSADLSLVEQRNPVGRGVAVDPGELVDQPAPQIERLDQPITSAADRPPPAGLGALAAHWQPRLGYMGTADAAWQRERMPLMPLDFDLRHFNCAHPELILAEPLAPGTAVGVDGMSVDGPIAFAVPDLRVQVTGQFEHRREARQPPLDTLVVDTDAGTVELSCRATFALGRGGTRLHAIRVEALS